MLQGNSPPLEHEGGLSCPLSVDVWVVASRGMQVLYSRQGVVQGVQ